MARLSLETTLQETFSDHRSSGKADAATGSGDSQSALHAGPRKVPGISGHKSRQRSRLGGCRGPRRRPGHPSYRRRASEPKLGRLGVHGLSWVVCRKGCSQSVNMLSKLGAESGMLKRRGGSRLRLASKSTALPRDPDPPRAAAGKGAASSEQGRPAQRPGHWHPSCRRRASELKGGCSWCGGAAARRQWPVGLQVQAAARQPEDERIPHSSCSRWQKTVLVDGPAGKRQY